jgi:hypothetical protein
MDYSEIIKEADRKIEVIKRKKEENRKPERLVPIYE